MADAMTTGLSSNGEKQTDALFLRLEGIFDIPAAWRLRELLSKLSPSSEVTVDFSSLHECHDFALAALLQAVASAKGPKLSLRGLGRHQEKLLRFLRVDKPPRASAA